MTSYVSSAEVGFRKRWRWAFVMAVLAALLSVFAVVPIAASQQSNALEWVNNLMCGSDLGGWTSYKPTMNALTNGTDTVMSEGGKYSAMDVYGNALSWTTWNGRNIADDKKGTFDMGAIKDVADMKGDAQKLADSQHDGIGCVVKFVGTGVANFTLWISNLIVQFMSMFVTWAVNPKIICQDPKNPEGFCINLIAVLGGTGGSDGGIIGILYNGLYLGLAPLAMVCVAMWMLWKGLVKGEIRKSWFGLGWAVLSFILGVLVMTNPMLLAEAPMKASVMLGSCVIESLNGRSCLSSENNTGAQTADGTANPATLCLIDPNKSLAMDEHLAIDARMSTCKMWKAFVLEPWAQGQFGMSYEGLEGQEIGSYKQSDMITQSPGKDKLGTLWGNATVSLKGNSVNALCSGSEYKYHNIALYQLDLMSDVHDCGGTSTADYHSNAKTKSNQGVYNDWYYMIATMTQAGKDSGKGAENIQHSYQMWSGNASGTRVTMGIVAIIAACFAVSIVAVDILHFKPGAAILAIGYLFMGTILTVFAPMFMLVGIHPGIGKKMFLGWLELELSAIMKYFFLILWISMVVEIYGAILGSTTNAGLTLVFVIAMSVTLKTYQPELLALFGNVDLGGRKLKNTLGEKFSNAMNGARGLAQAAGGGAAAGFVTGKGGLGSRLRSAADMAKYQGMQQGKRMGGFTGNMFQSADRIYDQRRRQAIDTAKQAQASTDAAEAEALAREETAGTAFRAQASEGLLDADGNTLDYTGMDDDGIDALAAQQKAEFLGADGQDIMDFQKAVDDDWNAMQEEKFKGAYEQYQDFFTEDANGVLTADYDALTREAGAGAAGAAMEYARMQNMRQLNAAESGSRVVRGENGEYVKVFDNDEDEAKFNAARAAITDSRVVQSHSDYLQYGVSEHKEFVNSRLAERNFTGVTDYDSLRKRSAELHAGIADINAKATASHQALGAYRAYEDAHTASMDTHAKAQEIRKATASVTDNAYGAMWSNSEVERLENMATSIEASRAEASRAASNGSNISALGGVGSTTITDGAARMQAVGRVASTAAQAASQVPDAVVSGVETVGNVLSGTYTDAETLQPVSRVEGAAKAFVNPDSVHYQMGTAGTDARTTTRHAVDSAKQTIINEAQDISDRFGAAARHAANAKPVRAASASAHTVGNSMPGRAVKAAGSTAGRAIGGAAANATSKVLHGRQQKAEAERNEFEQRTRNAFGGHNAGESFNPRNPFGN